MAETQQLSVDVVHFEDEDIWVATSEDILGLVVESKGIEAFLVDVVDVAVQLLEINENFSSDQLATTRLRLRVTHELSDKLSKQGVAHPSLQLTELQLSAA